ncbi:MAG: hypothetical protein K2Y42_15605 [Hyphomicrobium sp.]|jgi:hypothetical protein|uniref:Transcriptional regulator domain-containing protein n=1 Tax=Paracoccus nototheniae TaxID=2489002 RepID=A0ABW4DUB9_9RHOB|nr:DUF6499 domain-containing protein [Hyphomicrobium sp.]MBX9864165.1 hypothetical protein [Hyphomicrobium sp.]
MSEEGSWRTGSAYDYIDGLNAPDIAWEFLRRNHDYRREYSELQRLGHLAPDKAQALSDRWGLSFRYRPCPQCVDYGYLLDPYRRSVQTSPRSVTSIARWHRGN